MFAIIFCDFIFFNYDDGSVSAQVTPGAGVNDKTLVLYPMEQAATVLAHAATFRKSASDRGCLLA